MFKDIKSFIRSCDKCQRFKTGHAGTYCLKGTISLAVIDITWQIIISTSEPFSLKVFIERYLCWFTSNHNLIYMILSSDIIVKPIALTDVRCVESNVLSTCDLEALMVLW